ncbi:hypothetical protein MC885_002325 [Smutsia gigantea]|nr:hypothetical protein MC885_002325 [Smutsia gigantea]
MYEDKTEELEKQLVLANSELTEAWAQCDQLSQKSGNLDDRLQKLLAHLHKREKELSLEEEQNKRLWDLVTGNSITIDHLRQVLDDRNMEVQHLEALLSAVKNECQGQMEWQMQQFREGTKATASFASHHSMKSNTVRENPTRDLKQLVQELSSVVNEEPSVPLGKTEEDGRTPSLGVSHMAVSNSSLRDSTHSSKSSETLSRDLVTFHAGA